MSIELNLFLGIFLIIALFLRLAYFSSRKRIYKEGQEVRIVGVLTSQPRVYQNSQRFEINGIKIIVSLFPEYFYGDKLKISSTLKNGVLFFPQIKVIEKEKGNIVLRAVFTLRKRIIHLFESFLPEPAASLLLGIFLGVRRTLPSEFYLALRKAGVLHVVVASGMNVTMVAGFILAFFNLVLKRRWSLFLASLGVLFYATLSGFDPPVVRAAIMGVILLLSQFFGRLNWSVLSLLLVGYLMIFLKPDLISDLGFQLSFVSVTGLIFIKPLFSIKKEDRFYLLKDDFVTTLSAQTLSLPILLSNFGQYQLLSLLVNTLVLWTTPILMVFGGIVALVGLVFPPIGQLAAFLAYPFLFYFEKVVIFFGQFSFAEIGVGKPPFSFILGYYCLLTSLLVFCYKRRRRLTM